MTDQTKNKMITEQMKNEIKIMGINFFIVSGALLAGLLVLRGISGELLDFYPVSFEVIFPFFTAIAVGEWGKIKADSNFDMIAAQTRSLFKWAALRYITVFAISGVFAVLTMAGASLIRYQRPLWELMAMYFPTAFFLSSLCGLAGILCRQEHIAALVSGIVWMVMLLVRSLLRIPGIEYIYLFIRFAGDENHIWLWNKGILTLMGFVLWGMIYRILK